MDILIPCLGVSFILIGSITALPPHHRTRLWSATKTALARVAMLVCIISGSGVVAYDWLWNVTATAPRLGALWRASFPGYDVGLDVRPATMRADGSVQLWIYAHDADDYKPLIRL